MGEVYWGEDITDTTIGVPEVAEDSGDYGDYGGAGDPSLFGDDVDNADGVGMFGPSGEEEAKEDTASGYVEPKPRKPKDEALRPTRTYPDRKRQSVAGLFTFAWGSAGAFAEKTEVDIPVGRVMQFQAPVAGEKFDELIAGTWIDKFIQPLLGKGENGREIAAILAFPLVVGLVERQPNNPILSGIGMSMLKTNIRAVAPYFKEQAKETKEDAKAMEDLSEIFEIPDGTDPLTFVWQQIFAVPPNHNHAYEESQDGVVGPRP